jgi:hypothetical protein
MALFFPTGLAANAGTEFAEMKTVVLTSEDGSEPQDPRT